MRVYLVVFGSAVVLNNQKNKKMTADQYVASVIKKKKGKPVSFLDPRLTNIKKIIRTWAGECLSDIKLSGSCAKDTAIKGVADCDLFISLTSSTTQSLAEIYNSLEATVKSNGYKTRRQNVSIGIKIDDLDVDLVPGKIHSGYKNYHSLYSSKKDTWLQTNIDLHINTVTNSGRQEEIVATKIWRELHSISFPSIYIELTTLQALKFKNKSQLSTNFWSVLQFLSKDFVNNKVIDPANTNNVISDMLTKSEKETIQKKAIATLKAQKWEDIIW